MDLIVESVGGAHISVDVQQEYNDAFSFDVNEYYQWMYDNFDKVIVYVNGEELGFPPVSEHINWLMFEHDISEEIIESMEFREKGYAFFRACIDSGYTDCLAEVISYMYKNDITDSRELTDENMEAIRDQFGDGCVEITEWLTNTDDPINIPDLMRELDNDRLGSVTVSGGGDNECLEEVRLALEALDIKSTDISRWIY